jgi:hypothetical protein
VPHVGPWEMTAGAYAAAHQHPHERFVWLMRGAIRLRIGRRGADDYARRRSLTTMGGIDPSTRSCLGS